MIINQSYGFTFIHIPKSAGTSVTQFLSPLNGPLDLEIGGTVFGEDIQGAYSRRYNLRKHSKLNDMQHAINMARPKNSMYLFTFVRHPLTRLFSIFKFLRQWSSYNPELKKRMDGFKNYQSFLESRLYSNLPGPDGIFNPQNSWIKVNGKFCREVKFFKIEDADTSINTLRNELVRRGAPEDALSSRLPHSNRSHEKNPTRTDIPPRLLNEVIDFYSEDFLKFGYQYD